MTKTVYIMRHSKPMKVKYEEKLDSCQLENEKCILSIEGEELIKEKSKSLPDFDIVYSSNYVRAMATAKYLAKDKDIHIKGAFRERLQGIDKWEDLPADYEERQFKDWDYKLEKGESLNETKDRITKGFYEVLNSITTEIVCIASHATALTCLLSNWCEIDYPNQILFKGQKIGGDWSYCETFKLEFDENNELISIENIK